MTHNLEHLEIKNDNMSIPLTAKNVLFTGQCKQYEISTSCKYILNAGCLGFMLFATYLSIFEMQGQDGKLKKVYR